SMAADALGAIPHDRIRATWDVMRVVACVAGQPSAAVAEARRLAEPVCLIDNLEAVAAFLSVEVNDVGAERLSRTKGEHAAIEAPGHLRQFDARGFQMTLHADVHLERGRKVCRVYDRGAYLFHWSTTRRKFAVALSIGMT